MKKQTKKADVSGKTGNPEYNTLMLYLREIGKIPLLSKEEEKEIARQAVQGDMAAREKLLSSNLRFVVLAAKKYRGQGLEFDDLISEGNIGMMNAINHFDPDKGCRFITYAVWWIRQAIAKAISEKSRMIRLPSNKTAKLSRVDRKTQTLQNENGMGINTRIMEIAKALDTTPEKAAALAQISQEVLSLDDPVAWQASSTALIDCIEDIQADTPVKDAMNSILKAEIRCVLQTLEKRAADVIRCRYGLDNSCPMSLQEVGMQLNLTRERVRQIENKALRQIMNLTSSMELRDYIA